MDTEIDVDIPCDPAQIDETGMPWAFLDEAAHPDPDRAPNSRRRARTSPVAPPLHRQARPNNAIIRSRSER